MQDFTGKVAVVTGAASGMGRAFATRFAREGMRVVLADVEEPALHDVETELRAQGHDVLGISALCPGVVNTRIFQAARNRPAELRNAHPPSDAEVGEEMRARMIERMTGAKLPAEVADILLEAIRREQFYVLTDREWDERIETRHTNIMRRGNPVNRS